MSYMLADSHCHLDLIDLKPYGGDLHEAIAAARAKDVKYILCPGIDIERFPAILKIAQTNNNIFAAVALHPTEKNSREPSLDELLTFGQNKEVICVGETGLDFYFKNNENNELERARQEKLFKLHIQAAKILNKPLIIHSRNAEAGIIELLTKEKATKINGVIHCFTESSAFAAKIIELGFYISFSGIITFRNAENLREIAKNIPLNRMLIETDAPYLAPVPVRGKSNEPIYLHYIAEFIAKLRDIPYELFAHQITDNFLHFCRL